MQFAKAFFAREQPNNISCSVSVNHHPIPKQSSLKYHGVILDGKLNWKPQIEKLVAYLSNSCGMLFKFKHYTNISVVKSVHFALSHSISSVNIEISSVNIED